MRRSCWLGLVLPCFVFVACGSTGWTQDDIKELKLRDWEPKSMLVTKTSVVETPRFPVTDIHNHLGGGKQFLTPERVGRYLTEMNEAGVRTVVNLDGGWDENLKETLAALDQAHPGRFATFALVNFDNIDDEKWSEREATRLEDSFKQGARGLKIDKRLGLRYRYKSGKLMPIDDPKLDPIWEVCAKHQRPVVIHVSDPAAFFTPLDRFNERWHELNLHPNWLFFGEQYPQRQEILDQLQHVFEKHPRTTFVNTHFGNNAEDLGAVGRQLDRFPNVLVDFDARISELGRQPYTARKFFIKYQDRILFGTDTTPRREAFRIYYRFLETDDEYFDCSASHHRQGFWMIYGIFLPDNVLEKIYYKNAERLLTQAGHVSATAKPQAAAETSGAIKTATPADELRVPATVDFEVTGNGKNEAWNKVDWTTIPMRTKGGLPYESRIKLLASPTGLYVLFDGTDKTLTVTNKADFDNLWEEDIFEVFLWPDEKQPVYFEYELSPLGAELPILVPNFDGKFLGWRPWNFVGNRKTRKATAVTGGDMKPGATIAGWSAEFFIPYELLKPLQNSPPRPGTRWRANFYRVDYDEGRPTRWSWVPVGPSFHEYQKFGTLVFE
ncbi:MAG: putative metal-dependent hydrolase of the TIM-barrel fold protein [Planctomycetaceae bacterium]|nr:putative metal-dependent hydrolase of the TIM-barrel fold protein [Planctomycetaceae bacterium]